MHHDVPTLRPDTRPGGPPITTRLDGDPADLASTAGELFRLAQDLDRVAQLHAARGREVTDPLTAAGALATDLAWACHTAAGHQVNDRAALDGYAALARLVQATLTTTEPDPRHHDLVWTARTVALRVLAAIGAILPPDGGQHLRARADVAAARTGLELLVEQLHATPAVDAGARTPAGAVPA